METVVALIVAGAVLIALETILPGLIAGILGVLCLLAGIGLAFARFGVHAGLWTIFLVGVGLIAGTATYLRFFPDSRVARRFVLHRTIGNTGAEDGSLLHQSGVALTTLRPAGTALISGRRIDVVTEGALIERGAAIKVVALDGLRVVVRATT